MKWRFVVDAANAKKVAGNEVFSGLGHLSRCLSLADVVRKNYQESTEFFVRTDHPDLIRRLVPSEHNLSLVAEFEVLDDGSLDATVIDSNLLSVSEAMKLQTMIHAVNLAPRGLAPCYARISILNTSIHSCTVDHCTWKDTAMCGPQYSLAVPFEEEHMLSNVRSIHVIPGGNDDFGIGETLFTLLSNYPILRDTAILFHGFESTHRHSLTGGLTHFEFLKSWPLNAGKFSPRDLAIVGAGQSAEEMLGSNLATIIIAGSNWHALRAQELSLGTGAAWIPHERVIEKLPTIVDNWIGGKLLGSGGGPFDGHGVERVAATLRQTFRD